MKLTRDECIRALNWFKNKQCQGCVSKYPDCWSKCIGTPYKTLEQLINEHFTNSIGFQNFKFYSDSYLKTLKKDFLIDYIHTIYKNWQSLDSTHENVINVNFSLLSEIDKLNKTLEEVRGQAELYMNECNKLRNQLDQREDGHILYGLFKNSKESKNER